MDKRRTLQVIVCVLLLIAALPVSFGDECASCCGSFCDENICVLRCDFTYKSNPLIRGCLFWEELTDTCHNCRSGDMDIGSCPDYPNEKSCKENPCGIGAGCEWNGGYCTRKLVPAEDCRYTGCPGGYTCIPNGECTSLSVKDYCTRHNYLYNGELLTKKCDDPIYPPLEQALCRECQSDYELGKTTDDIRGMIYGAAAGLAVLLLAINGMKLLTAEDAAARSGAKKGVVYIIIGLAVIVSALSFIEDVYKTPPVTPSSISKPNQKPVAQARVGLNPSPGLKYLNTETGVRVYFDASESKDVDGSLTEYRWEFGDGVAATGITAEHVYSQEEVYTVKLTVLDDEGEENSDTAVVTTKRFETVIFSPENGAIIYQVGRITEFRGAARYGTPCSPPDDYKYNWTWDGTFMSDDPTFTRNTLDLPLGRHTLALSAEDCAGHVARNTTEVFVVKPLISKIIKPEKDRDSMSESCVNDSVTFVGTAYGGRPPYRYKWTAGSIVFAEGTISGEGVRESKTVPLGPGGISKGTRDITLEINDSLGLVDQDTRQDVTVDCDKCAEYRNTGRLPTRFNWKDLGYMTNVKDQGACGSCTTFAICASLEGEYKVAKKDSSLSPDLSEQYLISCASGSVIDGCDGNNLPNLFFWVKNNGVGDGTCFRPRSGYPYDDYLTIDIKTNVPCSTKLGTCALWTTGDLYVEDSDERVKAALICQGPIAAASRWEPGAHAYTLAGFDDDNSLCRDKYGRSGCWIVKNSWGLFNGWDSSYSIWHVNGYAYIPYGDSHAIFDEGSWYAEGIKSPTDT